eukprot:1181864-Prorocentrum_minimum.AAC.1
MEPHKVPVSQEFQRSRGLPLLSKVLQPKRYIPPPPLAIGCNLTGRCAPAQGAGAARHPRGAMGRQPRRRGVRLYHAVQSRTHEHAQATCRGATARVPHPRAPLHQGAGTREPIAGGGGGIYLGWEPITGGHRQEGGAGGCGASERPDSGRRG